MVSQRLALSFLALGLLLISCAAASDWRGQYPYQTPCAPQWCYPSQCSIPQPCCCPCPYPWAMNCNCPGPYYCPPVYDCCGGYPCADCYRPNNCIWPGSMPYGR
jgi:hypothetical protein